MAVMPNSAATSFKDIWSVSRTNKENWQLFLVNQFSSFYIFLMVTSTNMGISQGKFDTYLELLRDGLISVADVAKRLCLSEDAVKQMMK